MTTSSGQSTRPPPSSHSLLALLELVPPSPILSPSDLSTPLTSGEIPIFLFDGSYSKTESLDDQQSQRPLDINPRTQAFNLSTSTLCITDHDSDGLSLNVDTGASTSHLNNTRTVFDTFGYHRHGRHRLSLCWTSTTATGDFVRKGGDKYEHSLNVDGNALGLVCYEDSWIGESRWDHLLRSATIPEKDRREVSARLEPIPGYETHLANDETPSTQDSTTDDARSEGCSAIMPSTPNSNADLKFQNQSSITSATQGIDPISFREPLHLVNKDDMENSGYSSGSGEIGSVGLCLREISPQNTGSSSSLSRRPALRIGCPSLTLQDKFQLPVLGDTASPRSSIQVVQTQVQRGNQTASGHDHGIGSTFMNSPDIQLPAAAQKLPSPSPRLHPPQPPQTREVAQVPTTAPRGYQQRPPHQQFPWLQSAVISLLIDQEGFRTVQPAFKQVRIEADAITFVPAMRQTFLFHYAPFDRLPILRRLFVNGDESRDFLSRQANLSLKYTGPYTVHGTEVAVSNVVTTGTVLTSPDGNPDNGARSQESSKLFWQFDYSVEDRRAEQTGRIMEGERILIPLAFTCSPRLLHPRQGKKIKLMQIVKKGVTPKLVAEKIQSPSLYPKPRTPASPTITATIPPSSPSWKTGLQNATQLCFAKTQNWNIHRRSQSNPREAPKVAALPRIGPLSRHRNSVTVDASPIPNSLAGDSESASLRRRRASSAGETQINSVTTSGSPLLKNILPPSRLRQIFEDAQPESPNRPLLQEAPPLDFFPLKPSPRFRN